MFDEAAAAREPGGPVGPEERVSPTWLILQRLDDFRERFGELKSEISDMRTDLRRLDDKVEGMRNWFVGTLFTLIVGFGTVLATVLSRHP